MDKQLSLPTLGETTMRADLTKVRQVAERFVSVTNQSLPEHFDIDLGIALAEYQLRSSTKLDLDRMLATDDLYSFKHDVIGIYNKDNFVPRFSA
jgi:hypothetical protein